MINFKLKLLLISIVLCVYLNWNKVDSCEHGHAHHGHGHDHHHGHGHDHHHGHHHGHAHEKPSFKYSREANQPKPDAHAHAHGSHGHAHSHGGHDHAHTHSHGGNDHAHTHSHGGNDHGHAHEHVEKPKSKETNEPSSKHNGHSHDHTEKSKRSVEQPKPRDKFTIALHAGLSTVLISIAPFVILFFIPLKNNNVENQSLLKVLLAFASGSLLGDAFLHLIPHALHPHDHHDEHSHSHSHEHEAHDHSAQTAVGLWVLAGILVFLLVEKVVRNLNGEGHTHSHGNVTEKNEEKKEEPKEDESNKKGSKKDQKKDEKKEKKEKTVQKSEIQVAGYLNLAADFAHNFTDGLAIGASFLAGQNIGLVTTLTILFHEIPHEIGDFAILIQSGCSKTKAIYLQLLTALGALSGTFLSLFFESAVSGFATSCILPFTAGGFIYIATVSIIPDLKESSGLKQSLKEIMALVAGIAMMVVIVFVE